jgi:hypothetical protein
VRDARHVVGTANERKRFIVLVVLRPHRRRSRRRQHQHFHGERVNNADDTVARARVIDDDVPDL